MLISNPSAVCLLQISYLVAKARSTVLKLDKTQPEDELTSIRIRSKQHEIIVAPEAHNEHEYILVAVHTATVA